MIIRAVDNFFGMMIIVTNKNDHGYCNIATQSLKDIFLPTKFERFETYLI